MARLSFPFLTRRLKTARRREELRRHLWPQQRGGVVQWVQRPEFFVGLLVTTLFVIAAGVLVTWSREQVRVTDGQIMTETRLRRLSYTLVDEQRTAQERMLARERAPAVYSLNAAAIEALRTPLQNLPVLAASVGDDMGGFSAEIRQQFNLDSAAIAVLAPHARDGQPTAQWTAWVDKLLTRSLPAHPLIPNKEYHGAMSKSFAPLLRGAEASVSFHTAIPFLEDAPAKVLPQVESQIVRDAGFPADAARYVAARLIFDPQPTFVFDQAASESQRALAERQVEPILREYREGEVMYRRGDRLSVQQLEDVRKEWQLYQQSEASQAWLGRLGALGLIAIVAVLLAGYVASFYPRVVENSLRAIALTALVGAMLGVAVVAAAAAPTILYAAAIAPTLVVAIVVLLAYDQRLALFMSAVQCMLVVLAVERGAGFFILVFAGCATMIAQLREVRHRNAIILASLGTAAVVGLGAIMLDLMGTPLVEGIARQISVNAFAAAAASVFTGFFILGILPSIERMFDITTGMTLAELRDPRQPLLKQLQQKAPGTYNHSLQVANIAEAAAEAIGANGLLTYVGALYHDIGKMNKPEYFVENQVGGTNKHEKLSPAMSLLVIIGHVKDGIELAREYRLPRQIQQFIETHHGTTLVEYFYHAARTKARSDQSQPVDEVEFRYPGPKPRSREAAILMLSDAVESTTRSLDEPTPSRIETVVRELSRKRLRDGQFDHCELTFRDLGLIEESIIKSMCAIYHGRIAYPSDQASAEPQDAPAAPKQAAV